METKTVLICHTELQKNLRKPSYAHYFAQLPKSQIQKVAAYNQYADQVASVMGKHLLLKGLSFLGFTRENIKSFQYGKNNRPFLASLPQLDFNISHSGQFIVCALSTDAKVGIDIEKKESINLLNFRNQLTENQWEDLQGSEQPETLFYQLWVQKEALVKADGSGLQYPFSTIDIQQQRALLNEQTWLLQPIDLAPEYCVWLASNQMVIPKLQAFYFDPEP
ncbi:MAG: 4'-phosphopantetheinyl transferase superfamily protein [Bacteroidota bacterium]